MRGATATVFFDNMDAIKIYKRPGFIDNEIAINNFISSSDANKSHLALMREHQYKGVRCMIGRRMLLDAGHLISDYHLAGKMIKHVYLALKEVHALGILHRDISLNNILWDGKRFYLSDFGHAMIYDDLDPNKAAQDYLALIRCLKLYLCTDIIRRSHFTKLKYWRIYNDCRDQIPSFEDR